MRKKMVLVVVNWVLVSLLTAGDITDLHSTWNDLLQKYVKGGIVDYKGMAGEVKVLDRYLARLGKEDIFTYSPAGKLAFWINAYNAFTVKLILNYYPVKSIRKISNPWGKRIWKAAGQTVSLDDIEHKILRKRFKEPRIHFAIVCASIGCPDLQSFAYRGEKINDQLAMVARKFFASAKHFEIKANGDRVVIYISKIFNWFGSDFGKNKEERIAFMQPYLDQTTMSTIKKAKIVKFKYLDYDWNLNGK
jgi:hypothetical protein